MKFTNELVYETSPYLLQHAHNPVNWVAWNDNSLKRAKIENKPIILSIGYSACHWCHVMEHESFENEQVAAIMNKYFVCIKVDREERPDVDAIYMDAIQAMGIHGGWPLNVFLMPDTKPFYGGTYFPAPKWAGICENIQEAFEKNNEDLQKSAEEFANNLQISETQKYGLVANVKALDFDDIEHIVRVIHSNTDSYWGGMNKAPKFPMPSIWFFLYKYLKVAQNTEILNELSVDVNNTLARMAMGGIFDQIGGGFSRYSVDNEWFCPHFEKMLYDNAQLLTLYSEAYIQTQEPLFKEVIEQTIGWLQREMLTAEGAYFAAQDADSEGVEGKFYVWEKAEIEAVLGEKAELFCKSFLINEKGNWEHGNNILWKKEAFLNAKFSDELVQLLSVRNNRIFPGLDDKILCSWNALMVSGLVDAYRATNNKNYLKLAKDCANFIKNKFYKNEVLFRTYKNDEAKINGFLEDYATVIASYIGLYQVDFDENWLSIAESLTLKCIQDFFDEEESFFNFSDINSSQLIANKKEIFDNVIPCSNSIMAHNLYDLGVLLGRNDFIDLSKTMISKMKALLQRNGEYLSNWARLALKIANSKIEIVIYGIAALELSNLFIGKNLPDYYLLASNEKSDLPLFLDRQPPENKTFIYVCINNTCALPVESPAEAIQIIENWNRTI